jgi:hypothetical protein
MAPSSSSSSDHIHLPRVGRTLDQTDTDLGPLADLVGTWVGSKGWSLIALPKGNGFDLKVNNYIETLTFSALGALVPNRGDDKDLLIPGLRYEQVIADAKTNQPLHIENGMWLLLNGQKQTLARQSSIPHGNVLLALGNAQTSCSPNIPTNLSSMPDAGDPPFGYLDPYMTENNRLQAEHEPFDIFNPNQTLLDIAKKQEFLNTVELKVSTAHNEGISNIPFIEEQANTTAFESTYWIETLQGPPPGGKVLQLQYSQKIDIEFLPKFNAKGKIMWPHITLNTLIKQ